MSMSVEEARQAVAEAYEGFENATRHYEDCAKAYAAAAPIVDAYKAALEELNNWRFKLIGARIALQDATRAEAASDAA